MDFLNHDAVILKNQLKIIEIKVWDWHNSGIEAHMKDKELEDGTFVPPGEPLPGILYTNINGHKEIDFFKMLEYLQADFFKEVDSNLKMKENKSHIKQYLKKLQKDFIEIKKDFSQEEKRFGRRIIPYFKYANAEIKNDTEKLADEEVKNKVNPTYEEIEVKENPTKEEIKIMLTCSDIFYKLKKMNIDIINKLELRLIKIEKQGIIEKTKMELKLTWKKSSTDLMELITSLVESDSISSKEKFKSSTHKHDVTRKHAVKIFEEFFGYEIKNSESLLSRATTNRSERKIKEKYAPFLTLLKEKFEEYVENKSK